MKRELPSILFDTYTVFKEAAPLTSGLHQEHVAAVLGVVVRHARNEPVPAQVPDGLVDTLRKFNAWRKGEIHEWDAGTHSGPDPQEITKAIDAACALLSAAPVPAQVPDDVDLWSFLRCVLKRGAAIESQFSQQGYETFVSEIEAAARNEDKKLRAMLAAAQEGK